MSLDISERSFEEAIDCGLLQFGPDACAGDATAFRETPPTYGDTPPGGYRKRRPEDYDRTLCLLPRDVVDFVLATQPKEWQKLAQHYGPAREQFLKRLAAGIARRGALDVLRNGIKDSGCKFRLAYFRPASGLNEETRRLYLANLFASVRQLRYSARNEKSLDLVPFLNGIPIFTVEIKNPLTGQDIEDAVRQYKTDRNPREPLLAYGRCLAHFAVDPDLVYVTTRLAGSKTRFLPFNRGKFGGAGNPPVPPTQKGYATAYLWEETWARDSVLDLVRQFIHEVEEEDERGRKTGKRFLIFPRYQQLDCVRRLVADARERGAGQRYLIQHSAGCPQDHRGVSQLCVVSCQRSPEPVFLKWKGLEAVPEGDFFVRSGPGTVKLLPDSAREYIRTSFAGYGREKGQDAPSGGVKGVMFPGK
jgi:type I restriction enzyme R subunit